MAARSSGLAFTCALVGTSVKAALALRGAFVVQATFMFLNNFTFFVFWWALMQRVPSLRGWHLADVEVLFGVVAAAFGLTVTFAGGVKYLGRLIDDGNLDTLLTQPKPVLVHALGMRSQPSGLGDLLSGVLLIALSGQVSWRAVPIVAGAVIAGALVFIACGIMFFSLAFWIGKADTLAQQLWDLLITFAVYPEPLFGGMLRLLLFTALPAGFVGYVPARVVRAPSAANVALLAAGAVVYIAAAVRMFEHGLRRYASGSRFSTFG